MKLINQSFEIIEQQNNINGILKLLELIENHYNKYENNSSIEYIKQISYHIINDGHSDILGHCTIYLCVPYVDAVNKFGNWVDEEYCYYNCNKVIVYKNNYYITTNLKFLIEHELIEDLKYICEPTTYHEKRITVKFICDTIVANELLINNEFSFTKDYNTDNSELSFIIPFWLNYDEQQFKDKNDDSCTIRTDLSENEFFIDLLLEAENTYKYLVKYCKWSVDKANIVLPNLIKNELFMTGFVSDWKNIINKEKNNEKISQLTFLFQPLYDEFVKNNYLK